MGRSQSKVNDKNLDKTTTRRLKIGIKFGKDADGGVEAGLACGYEKKKYKTSDAHHLINNEEKFEENEESDESHK